MLIFTMQSSRPSSLSDFSFRSNVYDIKTTSTLTYNMTIHV